MRSAIGSPPHAWGDRRERAGRHIAVRFTPTRVGRSWSRGPSERAPTVHPHTREEIALSPHTGAVAPGSPPHAWGDQGRVQGRDAVARFTPTRVGRSRPTRSCRPPAAVHPHTRGEIGSIALFALATAGSPPHAWGDRISQASGYLVPRFTPTRVGRSTGPSTTRGRGSVHPHTRGEIASSHSCSFSYPGSPPHAWGDLHSRPQSVAPARFTPTRVGRSDSGKAAG